MAKMADFFDLNLRWHAIAKAAAWSKEEQIKALLAVIFTMPEIDQERALEIAESMNPFSVAAAVARFKAESESDQ